MSMEIESRSSAMGDRPIVERPSGERPSGDRPSSERSFRPMHGGAGRPSYGGRPQGPYNPKMGGMKGGKPPFRQRLCRICEEKKGHVDWKAFNYLRNFVTDRGKILAGRSKGLCAPCQRNLTRAIKRAQNMA